MPPMHTGTLISPGPKPLKDALAITPLAKMVKSSNAASAAESRMEPSTRKPRTPFCRAICIMFSPQMARSVQAPPSTTITSPACAMLMA